MNAEAIDISVSLVVPVRNEEATLERLVESILRTDPPARRGDSGRRRIF